MVKFGKRIAYTKSYGKGMRSMEKGKKKKIILIVSLSIALLIIVIAAVVFAFYANSKKSSAEDAALQHAGVTRQEAAMLQSELDFKGFSIVCDVSFKTSDYDYDYEVSLPGLEILDFEKEYYGVPSLPQSDSSSGGQENGTSAQQSSSRHGGERGFRKRDGICTRWGRGSGCSVLQVTHRYRSRFEQI